MQKMLSKWGADEDDNAAKVLKRPSAKRPASAMEEQGAEGENATKVLKRPEIINAIFKNNSDGSWNVNLDHPIAQEIACREVIASCKKAKKKGEGVWNALLECPKTKTVQSVRANLRKGLTDIQTQLTLFEDMLALERWPLKRDCHFNAAISLKNLLELVDVANSYIQLNKGQHSSDGSWNFNLEHPIGQEIGCRQVIAYCKKAKKEGEGVWNALLECPKTETVQAVRANLRKGLTDIQTQLTLFEDMLAALPLIQDKIEADFMHAALSLENLLELVDVAKSYIQWYDDQ